MSNEATKLQTVIGWLNEYVRENVALAGNLDEALRQLREMTRLCEEWRECYNKERERRLKIERRDRREKEQPSVTHREVVLGLFRYLDRMRVLANKGE